MLFSTLSVSFLGLAALAVAAPQPLLADELAERGVAPVARGFAWNPRRDGKDNRNKNNNKDVITITELVTVKLTVDIKSSEIQLSELVKEKIEIKKEKKKDRDRVRKNHYRNKDKNVNTIVIVVTEVIDIRDSNNKKTRYLSHQVKADNKASEDVFVVVSESVKMTVGGVRTRQVASAVVPAVPLGTAVADAPPLMDYDPTASPTANNATMLLPIDVTAPTFNGTAVDDDPASILDDDSDAFVDFAPAS